MSLRGRIIRLIHPVRLLYWRIAKPERYGVKVMAFDEAGRVLLVRHSYGRSDLWMLPGGGINRNEDDASAAARELKEETALEAQDLKLFGRYLSELEAKRDHVALFTCRVKGELVIDGKEIAEAQFFTLDALPETISTATNARIMDWKSGRKRSTKW